MTRITRLFERLSMFDDPARAYGAATVLVVLAVLVRFLMAPVEAGSPFITLFPAVVLTCFLGGIAPAAFSAILACIAVSYLFMPPFLSPALEAKDLWGPVTFMVAVAVGCAPVELLRRTVRALAHATAAQHASEARLRRAQNVGGVGDWEWHLADGGMGWSPSLFRLLGLPPGSVPPAAALLAMVHPDDREPARVQMVAAARGERPLDGQFRIVRPGGEMRWLACRGELERDADGTPRRFVGVVFDVTDQKRAETALRAAIDQRETLLREIHHRVKNSLQTVSSLLSIQARRLGDGGLRGEFEDAVARIQAVAMVHQALYQDEDLSRAGIATQVELLCRHVAAVHGKGAGTIRCDVGAGDAWLPSDSLVPFALVVNELLTNAFKHAFDPGQRGNVDVRVSLAGDTVRLEVEDDGRGMPPGFEADESATIGMRLVLMFVRQLGGEFRIEQPGRGTRFVIVVPLTSADAGMAA